MNLQQVVQPRSAANGFGSRRVEREMGSRLENKSQSSKTNPGRVTNTGVPTGSQGGGSESPSRERLLYLTTCLIGHHVEVQVKDGSLLSGIFHAANAQEDFGIILKMARSIKGASSRWQKAVSDSLSNTPSKILIIPANELVQIMTKDVSVTRDGLTNELQCVKPQDIMIDSSISQSRHVEVERRELERWVPDEDDSECPELENIFDGHWNRGWNQFEANEALFGVKSTFDEDLYTTKLERGPQTRELEKEASRIAREIEGEETKDLHSAEERGMHLHEDFDIDEETRFSSVFRGVDDSGYEENEDIVLDSCNNETFGGASDSFVSRPFADLTSGKSNDGAVVPSSSSFMDEVQCSLSSTGRDLNGSGSNDHARQLTKTFSPLDGESRVQDNQYGEEDAGNNYTMEFVEKKMLGDEAQMSKSVRAKKDGSDIGGLSPNATAYAPSYQVPSKGQEKSTPPSELSEDTVVVKTQGTTQSINSRGRPGSATSSTSDCGRSASASRGPGLSPSSSVGSLSSEKSTLNPHAKDFKLNPNAKSFIPSQTPLRPASPVSDGSFYFPPHMAPVPHMHGVPIGIGMGPSFAGHQPVMFNPQAAPMQSPQAYFHPNGPQFGQQMILGHPRNVLYMPTFPPEMPYKGREF